MPTTKRNLKSALLSGLLLLCQPTLIQAAPAYPDSRLFKQPDGSETPPLFLKGNQNYAWMTDERGYHVLQDEDGWYVYGDKTEDGDIVSTNMRVGTSNPKKLGLTPNQVHDENMRKPNGLDGESSSEEEHRELLQIPENVLCDYKGTKDDPCYLKALVVLVRFSDHDFRNLPTAEEYDILFNNNGPTENNTAPTGSVADVFAMNSYDSFVLDSVVSEWIRISRTEADTVDDNLGLNRAGTKLSWNEAMTQLNNYHSIHYPDFDNNNDGFIDCLVILHSGVAAENSGNDCETNKPYNQRIWSHATTSSFYTSPEQVSVGSFYVASGIWDVCPPGGARTKWDIARVAVIGHECAHFLGLPDLYDTTGGAGVGTFDLLGNMWGWYGTQWYPPLMGAWSRAKLGWVEVVHITESGEYKLAPACTSNKVYMIDHNMEPGEYFLIEYRYPCGFDSELTHHSNNEHKDRSGGALWHVDETGILPGVTYTSEGIPQRDGVVSTHYKVALVQSDGNFNLEYGTNKGDRTDLFLKGSDSLLQNKAYKIGNGGITLNSGATKGEPNTRSYATGTEKDTGIILKFGEYEEELSLTVILTGESTNTGSVTFQGSANAGAGAAADTQEETKVELKHLEAESGEDWETRIHTLDPVTNVDDYYTKHSFGQRDYDYTAVTHQNIQDGLLEVDGDCRLRDTNFQVTYTGVGRVNQDKIKMANCQWFKKESKFCPLLDQDPDRIVGGKKARIWQVCQLQCPSFSGCTEKIAAYEAQQ